MKTVDLYILDTAERQHQLITREQFLIAGSRQQLDRRLASGRLIRVYASIYRVPGVAPTWRQQLLAACLAAGRPCAASFRAAALVTGLPGGEEIVEITCPRHNRAQYDGVIAHESRHLTDGDLLVIDGIPVTRARRTLCDLACLVELRVLERRTLDLALLEAHRRNLVDFGSLWREFERLGGTLRLGGDVMWDALTRFTPPARRTESLPESEVLLLLRTAGLPEPTPQYWLTLPNGEPVRLDFAWPDKRTSLEWDPYKYHGNVEVYETMQARTRLMRAMDWERVCVTDADFDNGMPQSIAALVRSLARRL